MKVENKVAATVFGNNTELDQRIERSVLRWGGEDLDVEVSALGEDFQEQAKEILAYYYVFLKEKYSKGEDMSSIEVAAAQMAQKLAIEGAELTPKEQANLYFIMDELDQLLNDPDREDERKKMHFQKDGNNTDRGEAFAEQAAQIKREVFYNLTGFDPLEGTGLSATYDEKAHRKFMYERDLEENKKQYKEKLGLGEDEKEVKRKRLKEAVAIGGASIKTRLNAVARWMKAKTLWRDLYKRDYEERVKDNRGSLFQDREKEFQPLKRGKELQATAYEVGKEKMLKYLEEHSIRSEYVQEIRGLFEDDYDTYEKAYATVRSRITEVFPNDVVDAALNFFEEEVVSSKTVRELAREEFLMSDMDKLAREALKREVPQTEAQMKYELGVLDKEIAALGRKKSKGEEEKLKKLSARRGLLEGAIKVVGQKSIDRMLNSKYTDIDTLGNEFIPSEYQGEFFDYVGSALDLKKGKKNPNNWKKEINRGMGKQTKFSIARLVIGFFGYKL